MNKIKLTVLAILALSIGLPRQSQAQYVQNEAFTFEALNQSMWGGSGPASASYQQFLGLTWDTQLSLGGIGGSENQTVIPGGCLPWPANNVCWDPVTADTRTGMKITASTNGSIGLNVGATLNKGSVDVTLPEQATLSTGVLDNHAPGSTFTIGTAYAIDPSATMHTEFPSIEAYADFVFDVYAGGEIQACLIAVGCSTSSGSIIDVNWRPELAAFNRNGDGEVRVLGIDVPLEGEYGGVDFAFSVPNLLTDAAASAATLQSSGNAYFLDLSVNVPALVAEVVAGAGAAFEGDFYGMHYTTFGADLGPEFGIGQEFTFEAAPWTTLTFSTPVSRVVDQEICVLGVCVTIPDVVLPPALSWSAPLGTDFDFVFPDAMTLDVTPTYWLKNALNVNTDFLARLGLDLTVLSLDTPLGTLGPVYHDSYQTDPVSIGLDDRTFSLAFNSYQGSTFQMTATPEPSTWILLGSGLLLLGVLGWKRQLWVG
jgi:hypothetical protein